MSRFHFRKHDFRLLLLTIIGVVFLFLQHYRLVHLNYVPAQSVQPPVASRIRELNSKNEDIVIGSVICGMEHMEQALVMAKSAVIFQNDHKLTFIMMCEADIKAELENRLRLMQTSANYSFSYKVQNLTFPEKLYGSWRFVETHSQPCAIQRLFFPTILANVSRIVYVDTDVMFLNDLANIWGHFHLMNDSHLAGMVFEHKLPDRSSYPHAVKVPHYGENGLNSGVMLMNLDKMRKFNWVSFIEPIYVAFISDLLFSDQDIINIFFHYHPDKVYVCPCIYNFLWFCESPDYCRLGNEIGVSVLHGVNDKLYQKVPVNKIFTSIQNFRLGSNVYEKLIQPLKAEFTIWSLDRCTQAVLVTLEQFNQRPGRLNLISDE